jgi:hypothetical protein
MRNHFHQGFVISGDKFLLVPVWSPPGNSGTCPEALEDAYDPLLAVACG